MFKILFCIRFTSKKILLEPQRFLCHVFLEWEKQNVFYFLGGFVPHLFAPAYFFTAAEVVVLLDTYFLNFCRAFWLLQVFPASRDLAHLPVVRLYFKRFNLPNDQTTLQKQTCSSDLRMMANN